jgi:hypothetical protein
MELASLGRAEYSLLETHVLPPMVGRDKIARILGYRENAGVPSAVVPLFIGETLFDTSGLDFYDAYGVAAGEWAPRSFNTLTLAELAVLDGATTTQTANKVIINDGNVNQGIAKVTQLHIGTSGSETQVTATAAQLNRTAVTTAGTVEASKVAVLGTNKETNEVHTAALYLGAAAGTLVASTAAQLDAAVAGTPLVYRTTVTAAAINTGTASYVVPPVAGKRFQVMHISMAATLGGGNVAGPTTVEVIEETAGTVFLSHVTADLTDGVWHNLVTGTPVITGITAGGMTSADNKGLLVTKTGGTAYATSTGLDVIVVGYYTTT